MTKSDLRTGMVVESADGLVGVILLNTATVDGIKWFMRTTNSNKVNEFEELKEYDDNLNYIDDEDCNIIKVYQPHNFDHYTTLKAYSEDYLIWERSESEFKDVTMKDIEEKFGCKVKIIG